MASICLTGKGMVGNALVSRDEWVGRIAQAGHTYTDKAQNCDILVASRHDTIKAVNAQARGVQVATYDWLDQFLVGTHRSGVNIPPPRVTPTKPIDTTEMEGSELWGMF